MGGESILSSSIHVRVEHADLGPVGLVFFDELEMPWRVLIEVVVGLVGEDDVQRDVEIEVVDRPIQVARELAAGEEGNPRVAGEVGFCRPSPA